MNVMPIGPRGFEIVIVVILITLVALAFNQSTRKFAVVFGIALLVVGLITIPFTYQQTINHEQRAVMRARQNVEDVTLKLAAIKERAESMMRARQSVEDVTLGATPPVPPRAEIVSDPAKVATDAAEPVKPDWVVKPPHWEGDVYVVHVVSAVQGRDLLEYWEDPMDRAARQEIEQIVQSNKPGGGYSSSSNDANLWLQMYERCKYRLWGPERYLETVSTTFSTPRYQMHGVLRFDPESRRVLQADAERVGRFDVAGAFANLRPTSHETVHATVAPSAGHHSQVPSTWFVLVGLVLLGLPVLAVLVALLVNPRTRRGTAVFVLVGAPLILYALFVRTSRVVRDFGGIPTIVQIQPQSAPATPVPLPAAPRPVSAPDLIPTTPPVEPAKVEQPAPSADTSVTAEKPEPQRPEWVDQPGRLQGTVYRLSVKSGLFVTREECERALQSKVLAAINDYGDNLLGAGAGRKIPVDPDFIRGLQKAHYEETVTSATVGPMRQIYVLLEFDDAARAQFAGLWQAAVVSDRLARVTLGAGVVLGMLAIAFGYLKLDLMASGQTRGRLRLAAGVAIIVLTTTAVAAHRLLHL